MIGLVFRFSNHCVDRLSGPIPAVEPVISANMPDCCRSMMVLLAATRWAEVIHHDSSHVNPPFSQCVFITRSDKVVIVTRAKLPPLFITEPATGGFLSQCFEICLARRAGREQQQHGC